MSACARVGGILVQLEHFTTATSETFVMTFCEVGDSLWLEVGKPDLSTKRRKNAIKTPRRRNLRLRKGWDLGLISFF